MNTAFYIPSLDLNNIKLNLSERPLNISAQDHSALTHRLSAFYKKMLADQKDVAEEWQPAGEWKNYNDEKNFLYKALFNGEISESEAYLKSFWRNKLGLIVKEYATFEALSTGKEEITKPFLSSILRNYIIWKDIYNLPAERLSLAAEIGNPWGCVIDGVLVTPKATRFHHNTLQLKNLLKACNGNVIAEIGAGYGALCHYLLKEIPGVKYIDFDLPETLVLAAYNLILNFPVLCEL